jgi:hypothetical protein
MGPIDPSAALAATNVLWPLIVEVSEFIHGGPETANLKKLPKTLRSEIALKRAEQRAKDHPNF